TPEEAVKSAYDVAAIWVASGEPKLAGWLGSHALAEIEQRYTLYVTFGVVLAVQVSETFEVPMPERVCVTLLSPVRKATLPEAGGEKLTLKPWLCPGLNVSGKVIPLTANPAPVNVSFVTVTLPPEALSVPDCSALVVPTVTFEKVKLPGEVERTGTVAKF